MVLDSCTTWSVVNDANILTKVRRENGRLKGCVKEDVGVQVTAEGTLTGRLKHGDVMTKLQIGGVKVAPGVEEPMIRAQQLEDMGLYADFGAMRIYNRKTKIVVAEIEEDKYRLPFIWVYMTMKEGKCRKATESQLLTHQRQGHLGEGGSSCEDCILGKMRRRTPRRREAKKNYEFGEVLSMDTDVVLQPSIEGHKYRLDVIDHGTCWMWTSGMRKRNCHENFLRNVLADTKQRIREVRVDGAKEFTGASMKALAKEFKFRLKTTARYVHEQAGKIERSHQTIDKMALAMMNTANLPHTLFWSLASSAAVYIKNRMPTKGNAGASPYEKRFGVKPDVSNLRVFGCAAYAYRSKESGRLKMENCGEKYMMVGYSEDGHGYLLLNLGTLQVQTEAIVQFVEDSFPSADIDWNKVGTEHDDWSEYDDSEQPVQQGGDYVSDSEEDEISSSEENAEDRLNDENQQRLRRSGRIREPPDRGVMLAYATRERQNKLNFKQAMASTDSEMYKKAIIEYLRDLLATGALEIIPRPEGNINEIESRWVCYKKYDVNGTFIKTKVRWTPFGFMQQKGVDFLETFAPVAISASNRLIYVIAHRWNRAVKKGDVQNAFQKTANTQKVIYARLCEGIDLIYPELNSKGYVMKLNNAINGTKQSGKEFNDKLDGVMKNKLKMKRLTGDPCMYTRGSEEGGDQLIVVCHVDDYQFLGMNNEVEDQFVMEFQRQLPSEIGEVCNEHLGVKVDQSNEQRTSFSQVKKIEDYCAQFQVSTATRNLGVMNMNGTESELMKNPEKYPKAIGCINYLVSNSRPDIAPVASLLASYTRSPTKANWRGVTRLLSYLLGTKHRAIVYPKKKSRMLQIEAYCDASFNSPNENLTKKKTRSRAGYLVMINGCLVKWYSKLISLTPQSTEEAEVIAANELIRFLTWLTGILIDMNIPFQQPQVYCDNQNAVNWIRIRGVSDRTKHFETKLNFCRDKYEEKLFDIHHIGSQENPADLMSKQLTWQKMDQFCDVMGLKMIGSS